MYFQAEDLAARAQESLQPDSSGDSSSVKKSPTKKRKKDMDSWGEGFSAMADLVKTEDTDCVDAVRKSFFFFYFFLASCDCMLFSKILLWGAVLERS